MEGFLVIERGYRILCDEISKVAHREPAAPFTRDLIKKQYRGIEGGPWPRDDKFRIDYLRDGVAPIDKFNDVLQYYTEIRPERNVDLIYISFRQGADNREDGLPFAFRHLGYDYGFYSSEYNHYSVLMNEILYGAYAEMREYAKCLNDSLLFPNTYIIKEVDGVRRELLKNGADLEECDEYFGPIWIFDVLAGDQ